MSYLIKRATGQVNLSDNFNSGSWAGIEAAKISCVRVESSDHHPQVELKLQYDDKGIYGLYEVHDKYVRAVMSKFNDQVCTDSCVEFFIQPPVGRGYLNFEMSCSGVLLLYHVLDATTRPLTFETLSDEQMKTIELFHTMPGRVEPEITENVTWRLGFFAPFAIFAATNGAATPKSGEVWHANFYKCADRTSHPHWISWQPVPMKNFHMPEHFGKIIFE